MGWSGEFHIVKPKEKEFHLGNAMLGCLDFYMVSKLGFRLFIPAFPHLSCVMYDPSMT
jgi:hypothetical protein